MHTANRLGLALLLLIAAFLVLVAISAASLWAGGHVATALVVGVVGLAGAAAGAITWRVVPDDEVELAPPASPGAKAAAPQIAHRPVRIQTMPVADLPPAYVDAVMKGAQARLNALKAQSPRASFPCK
jgi:hypothetical protein